MTYKVRTYWTCKLNNSTVAYSRDPSHLRRRTLMSFINHLSPLIAISHCKVPNFNGFWNHAVVQRQLQSQLPIGADLNRKQDALRECKIPDTAIVSSMHHLWSHSWVLLNTRTWPARRKFDQDEDLMDFVHLSRDLCGWTNFQRRWRRRWLVSSRTASRRCWGQENR